MQILRNVLHGYSILVTARSFYHPASRSPNIASSKSYANTQRYLVWLPCLGHSCLNTPLQVGPSRDPVACFTGEDTGCPRGSLLRDMRLSSAAQVIAPAAITNITLTQSPFCTCSLNAKLAVPRSTLCYNTSTALGSSTRSSDSRSLAGCIASSTPIRITGKALYTAASEHTVCAGSCAVNTALCSATADRESSAWACCRL
jgi:hypothetical protein